MRQSRWPICAEKPNVSVLLCWALRCAPGYPLQSFKFRFTSFKRIFTSIPHERSDCRRKRKPVPSEIFHVNPISDFPLGQIAFVQIGNDDNQPTIILLHDSLGCIELWRDFPKQLAERTHCNVLAYDRQGYGKSCGFEYAERNNDYLEREADILHALLDHWQIEKAILFGHSDGGSIALIATAKYPKRIMAVITEGAHIFVESITIKGIEEAIIQYQTADLQSKLAKYHGNKTEAMFWAWAKTWTRDSFKDWNIEHFLPSVGCPVLVMQGEDDEFGSLAQVEGIVSQTGGYVSQLIVPNAKHTPHKENPQPVFDKVANFLRSLRLF